MTKTVIAVGGMVCGMCEAHVNDAIRRGFSVRKAKADRKKGICTITSEEPLDAGDLERVVRETGYDFGGVLESSAVEKRGLFF